MDGNGYQHSVLDSDRHYQHAAKNTLRTHLSLPSLVGGFLYLFLVLFNFKIIFFTIETINKFDTIN